MPQYGTTAGDKFKYDTGCFLSIFATPSSTFYELLDHISYEMCIAKLAKVLTTIVLKSGAGYNTL